jgi:hypothetical protein
MRAAFALIALLLLAGCGDESPKKTAATKPALTPLPSIDRTELKPGVAYTTRAFTPNITFTLPDGVWLAASADKPDHVEIEPEPADPVDDSGIGFHHITGVFPAAEGGTIPGDAEPPPKDFAAWLTSHPHLKATAPKPVEALGLKGVSVDIRVKSPQPKQYKDCGKVEGDCVVLMNGGIEPLVYGANIKGRYLILEQPDGGQLVIEEFVEPASAFEGQVPLFEKIIAGAKLADG